MASPLETLQQWRRHVHYDRVDFWLEAHAFYVNRLDELLAAHSALASSSRSAVHRFLAEVEEFETFLKGHSEREERGMFRFLKDVYPAEFGEVWKRLVADHEAETDGQHLKAVQKILLTENTSSHTRSAALVAERRRDLLEHFRCEESACVPLMLSLTAQQYAEYQRLSFGNNLDSWQQQEKEQFPGAGRSLRGAQTANTPAAYPTACDPKELVCDPELPVTLIRVRMLSGKTVTIKANKSTLICDLTKHLLWLDQASETVEMFDLNTAFPPSRSLATEGQLSLESAGLLNCTLIQVKRALHFEAQDAADVTSVAGGSLAGPDSSKAQAFPHFTTWIILASAVLAFAFACQYFSVI